MGFISFSFKAIAIIVALLAILSQVSQEVRYVLCFFGGVGYLDFLGDNFVLSMNKCVAETNEYFLLRDFKEGDGKIINIHEFDCSNGVTMEKLRIESEDFTRPFICRNLLKDNKCRTWNLDYFQQKAPANDTFLIQNLGYVKGNRKAFVKTIYPLHKMSTEETISKMKSGEQIYVNFDNDFIHLANLTDDMNLSQYFDDTKWIHHTLFLSNFSQSTLGSPFHAAPNDNFFFQCVGRKHWYYVAPEYLKYTSAYISTGVTFTTDFIEEKKIVSRIPIWTGVLQEGDMMYNPPFWLHAVGTVSGLTISVANRAWQRIFPAKQDMVFDLMYKIQFPLFVARVAKGRLSKDKRSTNPLTIQGNQISTTDIEGGLLPVLI